MNMKELRKEKNLSQPALAEALGVSKSTISAIESGRFNVSEKIADKIKEVYGVELDAAKAEPAAEVKKAEPAVAEAKKAEPVAEKVEEPKAKARQTKKVEKKASSKKTVKSAADKTAAAVKKTVKAEKPAAAKAEPAAKKQKAKVPGVIIQSPMGGEVTPEEILAKVGEVDKVYVRVDQNKIYWVKGEESGAADIW